MAFRRTTKTRPTTAKQTDPRADLVRLLSEAGEIVATACGTCGATVRAEDPEAVQSTRQVGTYPYTRTVRSWRYHGVCAKAQGGPALLALVLDPEARPVRVTQAHYDVAKTLGAPLAYQELEQASSADNGRGRSRFAHVKRAELEELRAAVDRRHQELTVSVPHSSGWPCSVCGRSHELAEAWGDFQGRPVCAGCAEMVTRSRIPGNRSLEDRAWDAARATAHHLFPPRGLARFVLAKDMPGYSRHDCEVSGIREPWAYVADLPEVPLTEEEILAARLAEVEKRLAGASA